MRALLVIGSKRIPIFPDVPTASEVGMPRLDLPAWASLCVPSATPAPVIDRLNAEARRALARPALRDSYRRFGAEIIAGSPAEFGSFIRTEQTRWAALVCKAGIKTE